MCSKLMCKNEAILGMNGVAMARHGLILWENEATSLNIIFKYLPGPNKSPKKIISKKINT